MKKRGKAKYIFISAIVSICLLGVSYSLWSDSSVMNMYVNTGNIELTLMNYESPSSFDNKVRLTGKKDVVIEATILRENYQPGEYFKLYVKNTGKVPVLVKDQMNNVKIEPESIGMIKMPLAIDAILSNHPDYDLGTKFEESNKLKYTLSSGRGWEDYLTIDQSITIIESDDLQIATGSIIPDSELMMNTESKVSENSDLAQSTTQNTSAGSGESVPSKNALEGNAPEEQNSEESVPQENFSEEHGAGENALQENAPEENSPQETDLQVDTPQGNTSEGEAQGGNAPDNNAPGENSSDGNPPDKANTDLKTDNEERPGASNVVESNDNTIDTNNAQDEG